MHILLLQKQCLDVKEIMPKVEEIRAKQKAEYEVEQARIAAKNPEAVKAADEKTAATADNTQITNAGDESRSIDVPFADEIKYDDFAKLSLRVGVIEKCEEVKKSKKLLVSQVKVGSKTLQIVSGIKKNYSPEQMVGRHVVASSALRFPIERHSGPGETCAGFRLSSSVVFIASTPLVFVFWSVLSYRHPPCLHQFSSDIPAEAHVRGRSWTSRCRPDNSGSGRYPRRAYL